MWRFTWGAKPTDSSDASTIVERLSRSMEAAIAKFRSAGRISQTTLVWAPCLMFVQVL